MCVLLRLAGCPCSQVIVGDAATYPCASRRQPIPTQVRDLMFGHVCWGMPSGKDAIRDTQRTGTEVGTETRSDVRCGRRIIA